MPNDTLNLFMKTLSNHYRYGLAKTLVFSIGVLITGGIFFVLSPNQILPGVPPPPTVLILIAYAFLLIFISVFISVPIQMMSEALAESERQRIETIKAIEKKENAKLGYGVPYDRSDETRSWLMTSKMPMRDITERKKVELTNKRLINELWDQSERIKNFFNSINDAIFVHPLKEEGFAPFIEVNEKARERYGYTYDEFMNLSASDITVEPKINRHENSGCRKELRKKGQLICETVHIKKSGETFPVEINSNIFYQNEKPFILAVVRDITERKKAQKKREALITELQEALDNIKTLKGLLPICSSCKKIRNNQGDWDNLELYIETHSDAKFSHGFCPECLEKLYGNQEWYIKRKKKKGDN